MMESKAIEEVAKVIDWPSAMKQAGDDKEFMAEVRR